MNVYLYVNGRRSRAALGEFLYHGEKDPTGVHRKDPREAVCCCLSYRLQTIVREKKLKMSVQLTPAQANALMLVHNVGRALGRAECAIGVFEKIVVFSLDAIPQDTFQVANLDTGETIVVDSHAISCLRAWGNLRLTDSTLFADLGILAGSLVAIAWKDDFTFSVSGPPAPSKKKET